MYACGIPATGKKLLTYLALYLRGEYVRRLFIQSETNVGGKQSN